MRVGQIFLRSCSLVLLAGGLAFPGFAQAPAAPGRISQPIIVNGRPANGAYVLNPAGGMQAFTCDNPQRYNTQDGSTQGWTCYDQRTATYLLNALPPSQTQAVQVPQPVPQQAPLPPAPLPQASGPVPGAANPYPGNPVVRFPEPQVYGKVKIETKRKDLKIYVDGGFEGQAADGKKFSLPAGNHEIELRDSKEQTVFKEQVHVIQQKTVEIKPPAN